MDYIDLPIYTLNKQVYYQGKNYRIDNVVISGYNIILTLGELKVSSNLVEVEPTRFTLKRIIAGREATTPVS